MSITFFLLKNISNRQKFLGKIVQVLTSYSIPNDSPVKLNFQASAFAVVIDDFDGWGEMRDYEIFSKRI